MCKAHILRFSCLHGVLMGIEPCALGPCPMIKTTSVRLPQQPYRCYNCQHKLSSSSASSSSRATSCTSSIGSLDSSSSFSSVSSAGRPNSRSGSVGNKVSHPLPGVARQPTGSVQYCHNFTRQKSASDKTFAFTCSSTNHYATPHYSTLPTFLPHQDHPCPPCQIEGMREKADQEVTASAMATYPHLTGEMLVRNGRRQDEWEGKLTLERYVEEKQQEEKEMWLHVRRKWTQDLKKARILCGEEDGLGLLG